MITATKTKTKLQFLEERIKILGDEIDDLESGIKYETSKSCTAVELLYKARTIITRYESRYTPDLYLCDCNSKNKQSVQEFFEQVLKFHDDFPE